MLGTTFYHGIIRNLIVAFGTLFNNIEITRKDSNSNAVQTIRVPLSYGPKQKYIARKQADPTLNVKVQATLPRMAFDITTFTYDGSRKLGSTLRYVKPHPTDAGKVIPVFVPVPYDVAMSLHIMVRNMEDGLQVVEQILPHFTPEFTVTLNELSDLNIKRDIPIVLQGISKEEEYEGDFSAKRVLTWTLDFTAKAYFYGAVGNDGAKVVKTTQTDEYVIESISD